MNTHADKAADHNSQAIAHSLSEKQGNAEPAFQFTGEHPGAAAQGKLAAAAGNSPQALQFKAWQDMASESKQVKQTSHLQEMANERRAESLSPQHKVVQRVVIDTNGQQLSVDSFITNYVVPEYANLGVLAAEVKALSDTIKMGIEDNFDPDSADVPLADLLALFQNGGTGENSLTAILADLRRRQQQPAAESDSGAAAIAAGQEGAVVASAAAAAEAPPITAAAAAGQHDTSATASATAAYDDSAASANASNDTKVAVDAASDDSAGDAAFAAYGGAAAAYQPQPQPIASASGVGSMAGGSAAADKDYMAAKASVSAAAGGGAAAGVDSLATNVFKSLGNGKYGSNNDVDVDMVDELVHKCIKARLSVTLLTGTHGDQGGWLFGEDHFARDDAKTYAAHNVVVKSINGLAKGAIKSLIDGRATDVVILAWCHSQKSFTNWAQIHAVFSQQKAYLTLNEEVNKLYRQAKEIEDSDNADDQKKHRELTATIQIKVDQLWKLIDW